jgi:hypothetical protein
MWENVVLRLLVSKVGMQFSDFGKGIPCFLALFVLFFNYDVYFMLQVCNVVTEVLRLFYFFPNKGGDDVRLWKTELILLCKLGNEVLQEQV